MIATSYYVADCVQQYCGRESVVIHPVIQPQSVGEYPRSRTTAQNREYPRSSTTPLKGGLDLELQTSAPFKGLLIPSEEKGSASENELSPSFKGVA